jgi:putative thiamine transport system ATP-binding protein
MGSGADMQRPGLVLDNVTIALAGHELLSISHHVPPGDVLTVMGPSGSGKSTLLAFLGGFLDPVFSASGRVLCDGMDLSPLPAEDRHAGILFQDPLLFPHMSVAGNLIFAIPPSVRGRPERRRIARDALADIGLEGMDERDPDTLSGGQKARVALARVLVSGPRMLLLDEPFSKLDQDLRRQIRELVFAKARERRLATVLVTHDEADARAAAGAIIRIGGD